MFFIIELGISKRIIFFYFIVEDMYENILNNEWFVIIIYFVDNKFLRVKSRGFRVLENEEFVIN